MSNQNLEDELNLPPDATLTLPASEQQESWSLRTSGGATIPISIKTSLRSNNSPPPRCLLIGRQASTADIRIQHGSISRRHAALYYVKTNDKIELILQELGAKHGVHVNGSRVSGSITLQSNDQIVFGNVRDSVFTVSNEQNKQEEAVNQEAVVAREEVEGIHSVPGADKMIEPGEGLTGRSKREAEIAAMMASLDDTPTYTAYVPEQQQEEAPATVQPGSESVVGKYSLPVTERLEITRDTNDDDGERRRALTCFAVDPAGSRFVAGGTYLRMYNFAGMDRHRTGPFKTLQIEEGHVLVDACYSNTGDRILVATGGVQPKVLDRDGDEIIQFVRGDMYVVDPARTSGHTAPCTGVSWNPLERDIVATSSLDGSARIWNLNGKTQFQKLVCDKVYRGKNARGQKVGVTSVAFHPSGRELAFGTACGSIQIWNATRVGARPERVTYDTHGAGYPIHSLTYNVDGSHVASRSMEDDTVKVWNARRLSRSATPVTICAGLPSVHESSNSSFSHDGRLLCAGTSEYRQGSNSTRQEVGALKFYLVAGSGDSSSENGASSAILDLQVSSNAGAVQVVWHAKLNQVLVACSDGSIHIFFDRIQSTKGAILVSSKSGRPVDELSQLLKSRAPKGYTAPTGDILTPNALPMFRSGKEAKRKREKERNDPAKSRRPEPPATGMKTGSQAGATVNFTQFVSESIVKNKNIAGKDPREELFKYSEGKNITQTFEGDKKILADKTLEEEEEEE